jgi:hypothetical protein
MPGWSKDRPRIFPESGLPNRFDVIFKFGSRLAMLNRLLKGTTS